MTEPTLKKAVEDAGGSRRQFFKFLAASPLAALAYAAVPSSWLEPLAAEMETGGSAVPPMTPDVVPCASCGAPIEATLAAADARSAAVRELVARRPASIDSGRRNQ
jgi:hypothetical protein